MSGFLHYPPASGRVLTTDAAALDITGDIDVRVRYAADDHTPSPKQQLLSKMGGAGARSWSLNVETNGKFWFQWSANGTALISVLSSAASGVTDGAITWARATLDVDDGAGGYEVKFYLSDNGTDWTQLGTTSVGGTTTSIFSGAAPVEVGSYANGSAPFAGGMYNAEIRSGIDGTVVYDADFTDLTAGEVVATSFTEDSANAFTVDIDGVDFFYSGLAAVTGTIVAGGVHEGEIIAGGETIILTLTGDEWVATAGDDNAITTAIIAGITSDGAEAAGWNAVVKANMVHGDITRTSATVLTIVLAAEATYQITADETVTVTIPATALAAGSAVVASPTIPITALLTAANPHNLAGPGQMLRTG